MRIFDLKFENYSKRYFAKKVKKIFEEGFFSNHTMVRNFEEEFKKFNKSKFCLATSSGTSALEVILRSLNIKNKNVLIGSNTFIATAHAVTNAGGKIIPVDIENKYYMMCPIDLRKKINNKIGAVIIVHIGGIISPNINIIKKICKKNGVPLVEDAAQAQGSTYKNIYAGNFGIAGAISFFTTKVMTTGEGGMITTNNNKLFKKMKSNRQYGYKDSNQTLFDKKSSNYKMNEFSAALGLTELKRVSKRIKKRNQIAKFYQKFFHKSLKFNLLKASKHSYCNHYKQIFISKFSREEIKKYLLKFNIPLTGGIYNTPIHRQPIYKKELSKYKLPNTDYFCKHHFCPPCYPELTINDIKKICKIIDGFN